MDVHKQDLYIFCETYVDDRMVRIQKTISNIQESLTSETKSSAGDKHETGRAMLQLEREKAGQQLAEAEKMKAVLKKVPLENNAVIAGLGSLVQTTRGTYFLAISAGEYKQEAAAIYCISAQTPIGTLLLGKGIGDTIRFRLEEITILKIT